MVSSIFSRVHDAKRELLPLSPAAATGGARCGNWLSVPHLVAEKMKQLKLLTLTTKNATKTPQQTARKQAITPTTLGKTPDARIADFDFLTFFQFFVMTDSDRLRFFFPTAPPFTF